MGGLVGLVSGGCLLKPVMCISNGGDLGRGIKNWKMGRAGPEFRW